MGIEERGGIEEREGIRRREGIGVVRVPERMPGHTTEECECRRGYRGSVGGNQVTAVEGNGHVGDLTGRQRRVGQADVREQVAQEKSKSLSGDDARS